MKYKTLDRGLREIRNESGSLVNEGKVIKNSITDTSQVNSEVQEITNELLQVHVSMSNQFTEIQRLSFEVKDGTGQTATGIQEIAGSSSELTEIADQLGGSIQQLSQLISRFTL